MAARVNTKFIVIMLASVILAAGGVGALWYLQSRGDAERLAARGDEFFAQGAYREATSNYARAVRRDPANFDYLRKMEAAILQQRPDTSHGARELYGQLMDVFRHEAHYRAMVPESHLRLFRELHSSARLMGRFNPAGQRGYWSEMAAAAGQMLARVPEDDPEWVYGRLYRGMANIHLRATLTEAELQRAEEDLVAFVEAVPNHDRGWAALARGRLLMEEHTRLGGNQRRIAERAAKTKETMQQARQAVPGGPEVSVAFASWLSEQSGTGSESSAMLDEALRDMVDAVTAASEAGGDGAWLVLEAVEVLLDARGTEGLPQATRLVERYLERDPEALAHRMMLARMRFQAMDLDGARAIAEEVIATESLPVGFLSRMQSDLRRVAAGLLTDIVFQRWSMTIDTAQPGEWIEEMRAARARLGQFVSDPENDALAIGADGRLALMEGRYHDAAAMFERLIRDGRADADVYRASAYCLQRIGEVGLAHERMTSAMSARRGQTPALLLMKAQLELQLGRLEAAESSVRQYLEVDPDNELARQLSQAIMARQAGIQYTLDDPISSALQMAQASMNEHDVETARATLLGALGSFPESVQLLAGLASIEMHAGNNDGAREHLARALEIAPDNAGIKQLEALVRTGDPVEAAVLFFSSVEDEVERAAQVLQTMTAIQASIAAQRRTDAEARDVEKRAAAELQKATERLRSLSPDHPVLVEHEFNEAVAARNWTRATEVVQRARRANVDLTNGLLYEGRLALERRRPEQAVRAFQGATDLRPFAAIGWRGLAMAYRHAGNFHEALRAYEQAYMINPNDVHTIRGYLGLLFQTGDRTRAMRVARDAARVLPGDVELREAWLELENEHGNTGLVLQHRREIFKTNPSDRINAMRLALTLARSEPRYDILSDEQGRRIYTDRRWSQMNPAEQRRVLESVREQWRGMANEIARDMEQRFGMDVEIAMLRASLARIAGDVRGGERTLRDFIDAAGPEAKVSAMLAMSQYQIETGHFSEAVAAMRRAADHQDPVTREADLALADFLFSRNQFEQAKALYETVNETSPRPRVALRIVECDVNLRQFDRAEQRIERLERSLATSSPGSPAENELDASTVETQYTLQMLRARIASGRGEDHVLAGRPTEAQREFEKSRTALHAAERLMPANPAPHLLRAQGILSEYRRTRQRVLIDDALAAIDRAESVRAGDPQTALARVEVHMTAGNTRAAVGVLNRILERSPSHIPARRLLTQLHVEQGNHTAAMETIQQAIELYPTVAAWHELKGNLHALRNEHAQAGAAYRKAFELSGSPALLHRKVATLVLRENPDFPAALRLLQNERQTVERDPALEALFAHVLMRSGRAEDGRQRLRRSHARMRSEIAEGIRERIEIASWYQAAGPALSGMTTTELDAFIGELIGSEPDRFELTWYARTHLGRGAAGLHRAAELFSKAAVHPDGDQFFRAGALFDRASVQIMMEEYSTAAETLREALKIVPEHGPARNNLAFIKAEYLSDPEGALPHARRAAELMPGDAAVLDTVGWVYFKLRDYDQAEQYLRQSLDVSETAKTLLHMAHVLSETGRFEQALSRLQRASQLNPDPQTRADIDRLTDDIRTRRARAQ